MHVRSWVFTSSGGDSYNQNKTSSICQPGLPFPLEETGFITRKRSCRSRKLLNNFGFHIVVNRHSRSNWSFAVNDKFWIFRSSEGASCLVPGCESAVIQLPVFDYGEATVRDSAGVAKEGVYVELYRGDEYTGIGDYTNINGWSTSGCRKRNTVSRRTTKGNRTGTRARARCRNARRPSPCRSLGMWR